MQTLKRTLVFAAAFMMVAGVNAAESKKTTENSTKVKASELKSEKKEDIDKEITNARMRAASGSKKKYSMSLGLSYTGGSIEQPFGAIRPSIYGIPSSDPRTYVSASINGRYRLNKRSSITAGFGMAVNTPFHGDVVVTDETTGKKVKYDQVDIQNVGLGYSYSAKLGEFQTSSSVSLGLGTSAASQKKDYIAGLSASFTALKSAIAGSKLSAGLSTSVGKSFYDRALVPGKEVEWRMGVYPFAEYGLTDKLSLRTVIGVMNFSKIKGINTNNVFGLTKTRDYQSVGLSTSIARDIWIYPNVQFNPVDFDKDLTNFAVSATINL